MSLGQFLFNLDKVANGLTGGSLCHTISHRAATAAQQGDFLGRALCRTLDAVDRGHCTRCLSEVASPPFSAGWLGRRC
jgi:hypothetical protein